MNVAPSFLLMFALGVGLVARQAPAREASVVAERARKDQAFAASPTSPMAAVERRTFPAGSPVWLGSYGSGHATGERPPEGTSYRLAAEGSSWHWKSLSGGERGSLSSGQEFRLGRRTVVAYPQAGGLTLICFDASRPELRAFQGLAYFRYDARFAVPARLHPHPSPDKVVMTTSQQLEKVYYRVADLHFTVDGKPCRLSAFKAELTGPSSDTLFIPFTDLTTGGSSYAAGRYLEIPDPKASSLILDFNEAFNPLCNYAEAYNCPRPPKENALAVAIRAGERTYARKGH